MYIVVAALWTQGWRKIYGAVFVKICKSLVIQAGITGGKVVLTISRVTFCRKLPTLFIKCSVYI